MQFISTYLWQILLELEFYNCITLFNSLPFLLLSLPSSLIIKQNRIKFHKIKGFYLFNWCLIIAVFQPASCHDLKPTNLFQDSWPPWIQDSHLEEPVQLEPDRNKWLPDAGSSKLDFSRGHSSTGKNKHITWLTFDECCVIGERVRTSKIRTSKVQKEHRKSKKNIKNQNVKS